MNRSGRGSARPLAGKFLAAIGIALVVATAGCQSMSDGARQVGLSAQELGRRMSAPFRRNPPSTPSFDRAPQGQRDPFLPPPRRPDDEDVSAAFPRTPSSVTLGKPTSFASPTLRFSAE